MAIRLSDLINALAFGLGIVTCFYNSLVTDLKAMWHLPILVYKYVEFYTETCDLQTRAGAGASIHKPHPEARLQPAGQALQIAVQPDAETGLRLDPKADLPLITKGEKPFVKSIHSQWRKQTLCIVIHILRIKLQMSLVFRLLSLK